MSLTSELKLFSHDAAALDASQIVSLLGVCGADRVKTVMRQLLPDDTWSQHLRWLQERTPWQDRAYDYIAKDCPAAKLAPHLDLRLHQAAFLHALPPWLGPMRQEVEAQISPEVRGEFDVNSAHIDFGWLDILDPHRGELGWFFARSICSLTLFGYGLVAHPAEFEKQIIQIDEFQELHAGMQAIFGPIGVAAVPTF